MTGTLRGLGRKAARAYLLMGAGTYAGFDVSLALHAGSSVAPLAGLAAGAFLAPLPYGRIRLWGLCVIAGRRADYRWLARHAQLQARAAAASRATAPGPGPGAVPPPVPSRQECPRGGTAPSGAMLDPAEAARLRAAWLAAWDGPVRIMPRAPLALLRADRGAAWRELRVIATRARDRDLTSAEEARCQLLYREIARLDKQLAALGWPGQEP